MDKFVINGGNELNGTIRVSGAKNAVLPVMAAALLAEGKSVIRNVPDLRDTRTMAKLLSIIGAEVVFENGVMEIDASGANNPEAPYELVKTMRASFYVLGPLTARFGRARISLPGGCAWGPRPVDLHLKGMEALGAKVTLDDGYINTKADRLKGATIKLAVSSVGATGNLLMAAATADGETVIENAAMEPEIVCLTDFLNRMGADITGRGTDMLRIKGVDRLQAVNMDVISDRIEAGTYLVAAAAVGGDVTVDGAEPEHLKAIIDKLKESGANVDIDGKKISVSSEGRLKATDVNTEVYPGYPTDMQAQWIALMSTASGKSVVTDTIYKDRFTHVAELVRLGVDVTLKGNSALVRGVKNLKGAPVMSTDIRASASLIIAGLMAEGRTDLHRIYHIDRGYDNIEKKLQGIGADISREKGPDV
ncbi:MAG: UDP-N-acetylglucosamine 1-carboxyvinyltransferase [Candidatus Marinimicrobia bacterium]|nr:UDP-N-acetylglucosamine 1-carboxyvinyltransferase [Candidatus Neomarinimicrobiota bacterium]